MADNPYYFQDKDQLYSGHRKESSISQNNLNDSYRKAVSDDDFKDNNIQGFNTKTLLNDYY